MDFSEQVRLSDMAEYLEDDDTRISSVERTHVMPIAKKVAKANTNAAVSQGLSVRGSKATAAKVAAKKLPAAPAKPKSSGAIKLVKTAIPAPKKAAAVKTVTTVNARAPKFTPASTPLWTNDTSLTKASIAVKKFTADSNPDFIKRGANGKDIAAFRKSTALWAQALKNITRSGERIVTKGDWLIAFDTPVDSSLEGVTMIFTSLGRKVYAEQADSEKLDAFAYFAS